MEPLRPFFDLVYMDTMAVVCFVLALVAAASNICYAKRMPPLREYLLVKAVILAVIALIYAASLCNVQLFDPAPPPLLARGMMMALLGLMVADSIPRRRAG
jgi:uncharacterized membrane protein YoaK (UPF0700 family)